MKNPEGESWRAYFNLNNPAYAAFTTKQVEQLKQLDLQQNPPIHLFDPKRQTTAEPKRQTGDGGTIIENPL